MPNNKPRLGFGGKIIRINEETIEKHMSKELQRWKNTPAPKSVEGEQRGVLEDKEIALLLANICVAWPHLEDEMISVLRKLLGVQNGDLNTARLIFTSLVNQKVRIDVMRDLLEGSWHNRDKSEVYDEILNEFKKLNDLRNKYVHGRWWTHESGDTYLQSDNSACITHVEIRKVTKKEMQLYFDRINALWQKILFGT